jgi:hypothetical protein
VFNDALATLCTTIQPTRKPIIQPPYNQPPIINNQPPEDDSPGGTNRTLVAAHPDAATNDAANDTTAADTSEADTSDAVINDAVTNAQQPQEGHLTIPSSHHTIISPYHHLTKPSSHHTIISPNHHLTIPSSHQTIISPYHHTSERREFIQRKEESRNCPHSLHLHVRTFTLSSPYCFPLLFAQTTTELTACTGRACA